MVGLRAVLGGHGLAPRVSQEVDVDVLDTGGHGAKQLGVGFVGGGFGPAGAAGGTLAATVLNPLVTIAEISAVVCLRKRDAGATLVPCVGYRTVSAGSPRFLHNEALEAHRRGVGRPQADLTG